MSGIQSQRIILWLFCRKLQLEHLDLYLIHWPINLTKGASHPFPREEDFLPLDIKSVWRGFEQCVELGLTKSIGVSNFSCKKIEDLLRYANIPPAVNQVILFLLETEMNEIHLSNSWSK